MTASITIRPLAALAVLASVVGLAVTPAGRAADPVRSLAGVYRADDGGAVYLRVAPSGTGTGASRSA